MLASPSKTAEAQDPRNRARAAIGRPAGDSRLRRRGAATTALLLLLGAFADATLASADRQTYEAKLSSKRPGSPTGFLQEIHYVNPDDSEAKPHAVQEVVLVLPKGARIDTSIPARCEASELELMLQGATACSPETRVGTGSLSVDLGIGAGPLPRVVETEVTYLNNVDELILLAETTNTLGLPIRVVSRLEVRERSITATVPPLPGAPPPDPFLALKDVFSDLDRVTLGKGKHRRAYITTSGRCPRIGRWTIRATFTYRDGVKQTERSRTPCRPAK